MNEVLNGIKSLTALAILLLLSVWFWWPQVQDAVAYWGWPTW